MEQKKYNPRTLFGFDESNHGKFPEVMVLTSPRQISEIYPTTNLTKDSFNPKTQQSLLQRISAFTIITEDDFEIYLGKSHHLKTLCGLYSLLTSQTLPEREETPILYYDGLINQETFEQLKRYMPTPVQVISCPQGDTTIPIINMADNFARYISRQLQGKKNKISLNQFPKSIIKKFVSPNYQPFIK